MRESSFGYTMWARKTIDSEVFYDKPHSWFKIWFFLVNRVNYKDVRKWKRGECFTTYYEIMDSCRVTYNEVHGCIKFLRKTQMLSTRKSTRGFHITVVKYDQYQDPRNYNPDTNPNRIQTESTLKEKKDNKENNTIGIRISNSANQETERWVKIWNTYTTPTSIPKRPDGKAHINSTVKTKALPRCDKITPEIEKCVNALKKEGYTLEDFQTGVQKYLVDIINRKPIKNDRGFLSHRFYLIKFLKQHNGFRQFVSM